MRPKKISGVEVWKLEKGCWNKRRFADEYAARALAMDLPTTGYVYKCQHCNGWHITSKRIGKRARSDFYLQEKTT
jgi:hypothetical protein